MLSLKHFILQKRVLNLYRLVIRASRSIPDPTTRSETIAWFRREIERNRHLTDVDLIEDKLTVGMREVRQVLRGS
ncbi:hypothetical protein F5I97DRAFT_1814154 [Phlebopus sp. FC_14]|nr:hypothetical protein F5I97DRAFT_1814154 [Phlebopus sp. FC_14]